MKTQDQYKILKKHFGGNFVDTGLEGYVIPKVSSINKSYAHCVNKALNAIESTRPFHNWRKSEIIDEKLRRTDKTRKALETLYKAQKGDYIVISAQLGEKYKGKSVDQAREHFEANEFGLGSFEVGCILLAHPDIIKSYADLFIDCAGDEFGHPDSDVRFDLAPSFRWHDGVLEFGFVWTDKADGNFGTASGSSSGFFPQSNLETRDLNSFEFPLILNINGVTYKRQ